MSYDFIGSKNLPQTHMNSLKHQIGLKMSLG